MGNKSTDNARGGADCSAVALNPAVSKIKAINQKKAESSNGNKNQGNESSEKVADSGGSTGSVNNSGSTVSGSGSSTEAGNVAQMSETNSKAAETCKVIYVSGGKQYAQQEVEKGRCVGELPEQPSVEKAQFKGWYTEKMGDGRRKLFTASAYVKENITLYAKWAYLIKYHVDGVLIGSREIEVETPGEIAKVPMAIKATGHGRCNIEDIRLDDNQQQRGLIQDEYTGDKDEDVYTVTYMFEGGIYAIHTVNKNNHDIQLERFYDYDGMNKDGDNVLPYYPLNSNRTSNKWQTRPIENGAIAKEEIKQFEATDIDKSEKSIVVYAEKCENDRVGNDYNEINHYGWEGNGETIKPIIGPYCPTRTKPYTEINKLLGEYIGLGNTEKDAFYEKFINKSFPKICNSTEVVDKEFLSIQRVRLSWFLYDNIGAEKNDIKENCDKYEAIKSNLKSTNTSWINNKIEAERSREGKYQVLSNQIKSGEMRPFLIDIADDAKVGKEKNFTSPQKQKLYQESWIRKGNIGTFMSAAIFNSENGVAFKSTGERKKYFVVKKSSPNIVNVIEWSDALKEATLLNSKNKAKSLFKDKNEAHTFVRIYKSDAASDCGGTNLLVPNRSTRGKLALPINAVQIDHIHPKKYEGEPKGSNSYCNARLVSAKQNRSDSNKKK